VDQRDEETREKRGTRSGDRKSTGGAPQERSALRTVGKRTVKDTKARTPRRAQQEAPTRRRRKRGPANVQQELAKLAGRNSARALGTLMAAADAFGNDREREALRILRPLREQLPDSPSVRELAGLCQYRIGNYAAAAKELEAYADLSDSVDQHPVLMDSYRAQRRWRKVEELWQELAAVSPSSELVTEGRIVYAGALADQNRLPEALALLRKRAERIKKLGEHQLRLIYALADLEDRAGNLARARELFHEVRRSDAAFADVAERLAALG
jgi:tetratricopeptide (TPR) repeat protein